MNEFCAKNSLRNLSVAKKRLYRYSSFLYMEMCRVRQLLEDIETGKASPEWKPIVDHFQYRREPEARAVLTTLSQGPAEAALTKAAKAALKRRTELFGEER